MKTRRKRLKKKNEQNEMVQREAHHLNGYGEMVHTESICVCVSVDAWYATTKERHKC